MTDRLKMRGFSKVWQIVLNSSAPMMLRRTDWGYQALRTRRVGDHRLKRAIKTWR